MIKNYCNGYRYYYILACDMQLHLNICHDSPLKIKNYAVLILITLLLTDLSKTMVSVIYLL